MLEPVETGYGASRMRLLFVLGAFLLWLPLVWAGELSQPERERFLEAVEDYRFSDFDAAITALEALRAIHPDDEDVLKYLALCYAESGRHAKAAEVYRHWAALKQNRMSPDTREIWMGYARSLRSAGQTDQAMDVLRQWLAVHPRDHEASILYGDMLTRVKRIEEARKVWQAMLRQPELMPVHQAAAHYYLALGALQQRDYSATRDEAAKALQADKEGPYAAAASQLIEVRPTARKAGWTGNVLVGEFYTSNVELLPDIVNPSGGKKKSDSFTEADLTLGYQGENWRIGYALNSIWHGSRRDYDLVVHSGILDWDVSNWTISPRAEWVVLNKQQLFIGMGLDLSWTNADWLFRYQGRYRQFSKTFGTPSSDLSRLGGQSHELNLSRQFVRGDHTFVLGAHVHKELTKGDLTHNKSDDYLQAGFNAGYDAGWKHWDAGADVMAYWRKYARPDVTILVTALEARRDYYLGVGGHVGWRPFGEANNRIVLQGHWQRNASNYKAPLVVAQFGKQFTEWQAGVSWQYLW